MPTACINTPGCKVRLVSERLEVHGRDESGQNTVLRVIPIRDLDRLIAVESTHFTGDALAALLRADIPVSLIAWDGRFLGSFHPALRAHAAWRLR
ncbi:MAG: CRISPR-associated endonuclease Cas1, partial [Verrucomicrobiales bacterium]|nr:CRISPR-associated endonuclease Cas1 [Verrucomicrobiales bacterium]